MLSTEEKELVKTSYENGQSAEDIAEIHDLDEVEVLDFIDELEQSQQ